MEGKVLDLVFRDGPTWNNCFYWYQWELNYTAGTFKHQDMFNHASHAALCRNYFRLQLVWSFYSFFLLQLFHQVTDWEEICFALSCTWCHGSTLHEFLWWNKSHACDLAPVTSCICAEVSFTLPILWCFFLSMSNGSWARRLFSYFEW